MHDIYDPPPAPLAYNPPSQEPLVYTTGDLICLALLCAVLFVVSVLAWRAEPMMAVMTTLGGSLVILESWFTSLGFLHRRHSLSVRARWMVFLAALIPWLVGLGIAATLMLVLFFISDRLF
jgi:hypothetical protein